MFFEILLPCEAMTGATVAVMMRTHEGLLRGFVQLVHFALMAKKPPRVCKTLHLVAAQFQALVGTIMLVHVFAVVELAKCRDLEKVAILTSTRTAAGRSEFAARNFHDRSISRHLHFVVVLFPVSQIV